MQIDHAQVLDRFDQSFEIVTMVVEGAQSDLPNLHALALSATESNNAEEARRAAHSIKGVLAMLGDEEGRAKAYEMEQRAANGDLDNVYLDGMDWLKARSEQVIVWWQEHAKQTG